MNYTAKMADYLAGLTCDRIPEDVVVKIKHSLLDTVGVILGGAAYARRHGDLKIAEFARALGDREESTVLGYGFRSSARSAAFVNGCMCEVLDQQDSMLTARVHPCSGVVPAVLAVADAHGIDGRAVVTALVVGYEAAARVGMAVQPSHWHLGFQATGTQDTMGAAAAVGHLLGFDGEKMANALGIAGHIVPISNGDGVFKGYTVKPVHGGQAAMTGIQAALLADLGMTAGPLEGVPPRYHAFIRLTSSNPRPEGLTEGLGDLWHTRDVCHKPFPTGLLNAGPAEVTLALVQEHDVKPGDVAEVVVTTYPDAVKFTGGHYTDVSSSIYDCQLSLPYTVAACIFDRQLDVAQFAAARLADPAVHELASRVKVVPDEQMTRCYPRDWPAEVEVRLRNGRCLKRRIDQVWGSAVRPMTEAELVAKFERLAGLLVDSPKVREAADRLLHLEGHAKIADTLTLLACSRPAPVH
ncbi:MAG: MmgE/PrpD family protein [Chloroflexi bacterium]|nr:MmgE/PrpD family protein [Chloroflexota bacterium]